MGNSLRCPSGFGAIQIQGCYADCPTDKGFVPFQKDGGPPSCAFRDDQGAIDDSTIVLRERVPFLPPPPKGEESTAPSVPTLDQVKEMSADLYQKYIAEKGRFDGQIAVAVEKIGNRRVIQLAFRKLQDAEQVRDTAPEAYIAARNAYYTLTKGDTWLDEERRRVETAEIAPVVEQVANTYSNATSRLDKSSKLLEMINNVQQNVTGIQDEFKGTVTLLGKQIRNVQDQLNLERHKTETKKPVVLPFVGYILNALLVVAGLFAVVKVVASLGVLGRGPKKDSFGRSDRYYDDYY